MENFQQLLPSIEQVHNHLQAWVVNAVNQALTVRNLLIGYNIVEYEQQEEDRASYGSNLLGELLQRIKIKGLTAPELSRSRQFYMSYPQILGIVPQRFDRYLSVERNTLEVPLREWMKTSLCKSTW